MEKVYITSGPEIEGDDVSWKDISSFEKFCHNECLCVKLDDVNFAQHNPIGDDWFLNTHKDGDYHHKYVGTRMVGVDELALAKSMLTDRQLIALKGLCDAKVNI